MPFKISYKEDQVLDVARHILQKSKTKTLLFYGNMGVGKTTLIKSIVKALGSQDVASSPTFSIVNEYALAGDRIYHFDLYRINDTEEAYNFGIEDYLDSNHWKLIEWPEKIESILIEDYTTIELKLENSLNRVLTLKHIKIINP